MILVDTSVWVEHFRRPNAILAALLEQQSVASHPFIVGELALGGTARSVLGDLRLLPQTTMATDDEVFEFIARHGLVGRRIGYLDAHLLASAMLTGDAEIWTLDKSMVAVAADLGLAATPRAVTGPG